MIKNKLKSLEISSNKRTSMKVFIVLGIISIAIGIFCILDYEEEAGVVFFSIGGGLIDIAYNMLMATFFSRAAAEKGYDDKQIFRICFWSGLGIITGIVAYLLVVALPDRSDNRNVLYDNNTENSEEKSFNNIEQIKEYKQLLDAGIITAEEYETKKKELLK